jgi:hypothetical protein
MYQTERWCDHFLKAICIFFYIFTFILNIRFALLISVIYLVDYIIFMLPKHT